MNSAFEHFQKQLEIVLSKYTGAHNICDDIIIWGSSLQQHNDHLQKVLQTIHSNGLKINPKKCIFAVMKISSSGHVLSQDGTTPDPAKISTINNMSPPPNLSELKSFLGMLNFCHHFIKDFSIIAVPLRCLTKKDVPFQWTKQ